MELDFTAEVISAGRVTIPSLVRRYLRLEKGDLVEVALRRSDQTCPCCHEKALKVVEGHVVCTCCGYVRSFYQFPQGEILEADVEGVD